ncbi:MAG: ATP-binding cassette domain-containing protein [Bacillota bacterium]|nr:ATP-binding cassette domain-containing protein [Bacillota bacterium]
MSFRIEKGSTVAILGGTGSGKSSLVHLLLRLYDYSKGSIRIDGMELKRISRRWIRENIGIVLQEPFLFSKSIRENIGMGSGQPGEDQILAAASAACVDQDIQEFEKGYDTIVGERGVTLSGGQRQRIAIARTIARDVPILIFDDSLSAVDTETDAQIRKALKERRKNTTTIIISHRITTLSEADQILVLDRGSRLSTGQKQLVSFARAILSDPGMFILDEATSSVDTETEHLIQDALNKALEGRTSFIIAHRLSTIRSADRILVIDNGRIIEEGTHRQLIRRKGYYYRLYTNQFMKEQKQDMFEKAGS